MDQSTSKNQRKQYLIEPNLQKRIIWHFFVLGLVMTILNICGFFYFMNQIVGYFEQLNQVTPALTELIQQTWPRVMLASLSLSVLAVAGFALYGLYFSNRIAGPIYQIRKKLAQVIAGGPSAPIVLRNGDYFTELSDEVNLLVTKYTNKDSTSL